MTSHIKTFSSKVESEENPTNRDPTSLLLYLALVQVPTILLLASTSSTVSFTFIAQARTATMPSTTTTSKSQAATSNGFTARPTGTTAAPQDTTTLDRPSLHSLFLASCAERHRGGSGFAYPLRESLDKLGVPSGRPLLDILDDALAIERPAAAARLPSFRPCCEGGEPRQ
jgi:hypothetical protein